MGPASLASCLAGPPKCGGSSDGENDGAETGAVGGGHVEEAGRATEVDNQPLCVIAGQQGEQGEPLSAVGSAMERVCLKLHGVSPDMLPPDLKARLSAWVNNADLDLLQVIPGGQGGQVGRVQVGPAPGKVCALCDPSTVILQRQGGCRLPCPSS